MTATQHKIINETVNINVFIGWQLQPKKTGKPGFPWPPGENATVHNVSLSFSHSSSLVIYLSPSLSMALSPLLLGYCLVRWPRGVTTHANAKTPANSENTCKLRKHLQTQKTPAYTENTCIFRKHLHIQKTPAYSENTCKLRKHLHRLQLRTSLVVRLCYKRYVFLFYYDNKVVFVCFQHIKSLSP